MTNFSVSTHWTVTAMELLNRSKWRFLTVKRTTRTTAKTNVIFVDHSTTVSAIINCGIHATFSISIRHYKSQVRLGNKTKPVYDMSSTSIGKISRQTSFQPFMPFVGLCHVHIRLCNLTDKPCLMPHYRCKSPTKWIQSNSPKLQRTSVARKMRNVAYVKYKTTVQRATDPALNSTMTYYLRHHIIIHV